MKYQPGDSFFLIGILLFLIGLLIDGRILIIGFIIMTLGYGIGLGYKSKGGNKE